jgi:hypothetical protein
MQMNFRFSRILFLGLGLLVVLLFVLHAPSPRAAATLAISSVSALPNPIPANMAVPITVSAEITSDPGSSVGVAVYRTDGTQIRSFLGVLQSDHSATASNQLTHYSGQTVLNTPPGQTQLQISATGAGQTITSQPLKIIALPIPMNYVVDTNLLAVGGSLNFNNFNNNYVRGGFTPTGGAQMAISSAPLPSMPLIDYIKSELPGTTFSSRTLTAASGVSCTQVAYADVEKSVVTYCPSADFLFRFALRYRANDSASEQRFLSTFQQVIDAAKLAP